MIRSDARNLHAGQEEISLKSLEQLAAVLLDFTGVAVPGA